MRVLAVVLACGCGRIEFGKPSQVAPTHVVGELPHRDEPIFVGDATIDTGALTVSGDVSETPLIVTRPQVGGRDVAVLVAGAVFVREGATVRIVGERPLVIAASWRIEID